MGANSKLGAYSNKYGNINFSFERITAYLASTPVKFPSLWKTVRVTALRKAGGLYDVNTYRRIFVLRAITLQDDRAARARLFIKLSVQQ